MCDSKPEWAAAAPPDQPKLNPPESLREKPHNATAQETLPTPLEVLEGRVNRHAERIFVVEGQMSDLGFRIADHDAQLSSGEGITGKAKHWPVVTSQIIAGLVNALILLNPATWEVLPTPWPVLIPVLLQAVAAAIGGQFTHSKAEIDERLQDGHLVKPLTGSSHPTANEVRDSMRQRYSGTDIRS